MTLVVQAVDDTEVFERVSNEFRSTNLEVPLVALTRHCDDEFEQDVLKRAVPHLSCHVDHFAS